MLQPGMCSATWSEMQHVTRPARRVGNALGRGTVARRWDVRPGDAHVIRGHEQVREIMQPVRVRVRIIIDVRHDGSRGRLHAHVAGRTEAVVRRADQAHVVTRNNVHGFIRRTVIHHNGFKVRIFEFFDGGQVSPIVAEPL